MKKTKIICSIGPASNNYEIFKPYLKQVIEMFIMGVFIFTTIIFASDTFITLIKQIAKFGIPFNNVEQDIRYWNYSGRAMFMSGVPKP